MKIITTLMPSPMDVPVLCPCTPNGAPMRAKKKQAMGMEKREYISMMY